jgi:hypothetical protein
MCVFCAAAPAVAAMGAVAQGEERKKEKQAAARGEIVTRSTRRIGLFTAFALLVVFLASAFYHTHSPI